MRRAFYKEAQIDFFEENYKDNVVLIAREFGQSVEYVLKMPITRFTEVNKSINRFYKKQKDATTTSGSSSKTFGGLG